MSQRLASLFKALKSIQLVWSLLGITLFLLLLVEGLLRATFWAKDRANPIPIPDPRVLAEGYQGQDWPIQHYRELGELSDRWEPYVYFRQRPYQGRTIQIDGNGLRRTWLPARSDPRSAEPARIWKILMLGGSSLWGFGARDEQTIPSLIARGLDARGIRAEVRNLAEIGYVSTQEVVALMRELQAGYRPDLVLFYDGVNDTTSAVLERRAGLTTNEQNRVREFNLLQSPRRMGGAMIVRLVKDSAMFRLADSIRRRLGTGPLGSDPDPNSRDMERLADGVLSHYRANIAMVEALGREYGFRSLFCWQPVIYSKQGLFPFEREEAEKYAWTRPLFFQVLERIGRSDGLKKHPDFLDLSDVFKDEGKMVYIDFCHVTEAGNARIAGVLVDRLARMTQVVR